MTQEKAKYDLEERTAKFGENVIIFLKKVKQDAINQRLISQLASSAGSIGANYAEAIESESKKDFIHKICISKKEIKETVHWLRLIDQSNPEHEKEIEKLNKECHELLLIFSKIIFTSRKNLAEK